MAPGAEQNSGGAPAGADVAATLADVPPQEPEAERAVLGAMLLDAEALAVAQRLVRASDFIDPALGRLFREIVEVARGLEAEERLDLPMVVSALRAGGCLEELGGQAFLVDLADDCAAPGNVRYHCETVRRAAVQREAQQAGLALARAATAPQADPAAVLADAQARLERLSARVRPAGGRSLRKLIEEHPEMRPAVVHGLLREGETGNIIAPTKAGKSWLAAALAVNVGDGRPFLGMYPTERGNVLMVDNELHGETLANRLPRVASALGIALTDVEDRIFVEVVRGRGMDIHALADHLADVPPGRFKLVILDALYRFLPRGSDENSNADVAGIYDVVDGLADRLACGFVLIHHSSKGVQSSKSVTDVGSGAGAQSRAADTHLILRAHQEDGAFVLDAAARSWPPIAPVCLRWDFPIFTPAPDLDPADLRPDRPRRKKAEKPPEPVWTPADFVERFLDGPQVKDTIIEAARAEGLSAAHAKRLLAAAEDQKLAHRWDAGPRQKVRFSTEPQPAPEGENP